jgi:adenylate cyclase
MDANKENFRPDRTSVQESDVRAALTQILESAEFARSKRVGSFLRFVVEEKLAGRGDRLKAFSIAREVYGRDETFDPRTDTIVRVDAGRLRHRLASYYETVGRGTPVQIDIPKGGYTPTFSWNEDAAPNGQPQTPALPPASIGPNRNWHILTGTLVFAIIVVLAGWIFFAKDKQAVPGVSDVTVEDPDKSPTAFLVVLPLVTLADDPLEDRLAAGLVEAIVTDLAKLSGLSVMAHASLLNLDSRSTDLGTLRREYGATHALRGSLEHQGDLIRINVQLIDLDTNTTIWADRLDGKAQDLLGMQDILAERIVKYLAVQISPEEHALLKRHYTDNPEALALYRQALVLLMPPNDMDRIVTARHMFQRVIEIDPEFGGGYAGKGFSHSVTVLFFKTNDPGIELNKGINLALKAIETDPEFGMGYVTLAFAYAMSGRQDEALSNARRAIAVQPGDAFTQFVYGLSLTLSGNPNEAMIPLSEAIRLDPAEPRTPYLNVLGITYYSTEEYSTAAEVFENNLRVGGPTGPHMDILRASTYAELGQEKKAKSIISDLIQSYPKFPYKNWLAKWVQSGDDLSKLMRNLYRLGLPQE